MPAGMLSKAPATCTMSSQTRWGGGERLGQQQESWSCLFCQRVNNKMRQSCRDCRCGTLPDNYERDLAVRPVKSNLAVWTYIDDHEPSPNALGCHRDPPEPGNDFVICQVFLYVDYHPAGLLLPGVTGEWTDATLKGKLPNGDWRVSAAAAGDQWWYATSAQLRWRPH